MAMAQPTLELHTQEFVDSREPIGGSAIISPR